MKNYPLSKNKKTMTLDNTTPDTQPREFSDFSDNQDGYGRTKWDWDEILEDENDEDNYEPEENIEEEN